VACTIADSASSTAALVSFSNFVKGLRGSVCFARLAISTIATATVVVIALLLALHLFIYTTTSFLVVAKTTLLLLQALKPRPSTPSCFPTTFVAATASPGTSSTPTSAGA
jgi:hypothetical protein